MPNKMIPFPYEKKLLILISVTMLFTILLKINTVKAFLFYFFISMKTNFERINCQTCTIVTLFELYCDAF